MSDFRLPLTASLACSLAALPALAQEVVIDAGKVFDGQQIIENARILVEDGRVMAIGPQSEIASPEGATRVDHAAHFIMPELIAGHSHAGTVQGMEHGGEHYARETVERDLNQFADFGIAAVNALGMSPPLFYELRSELRGRDHEGADLYGAGPGIGVPDGAPPAEEMSVVDGQVLRPSTAEQAREAVREMAEAGVDVIKVWIDDMGGSAPKMAPEVYTAAAEEAHAQGLKIAAHIHDAEDAEAALEADIDILAHGIRDAEIDDALVERMAQQRVWYIPTINIDEAAYIYAEHPEWLEDDFFAQGISDELRERIEDEQWREQTLDDSDTQQARDAVATNMANLARLYEHGGIRIVMGTDSGATALRVPGIAEHRELELMVEAGMEPLDVLITATSAGADMLEIEDLGRIEKGARAQFLVLEDDPTEEITNTRHILEILRY
ncbi:amidohydrolase family protein [Vreelandella sp. EE7]